MSKNVFPIPINITESDGIRRKNRPVRLGIPFPCNCIHNTKSLTLLDENQNKIPFQAEITAHWHDNSIRWILIDFIVSCNASNTIEYSLIQDKEQTDKHLSPLVCSEQDDEIIIQTGVAEFHINKKTFQPFSQIITYDKNQQIESSECLLVTDKKVDLKANIDNISLPDQSLPLRITINIDGSFPSKIKGHILHFKSSLTFFNNSSLCKIDLTLHNPNAARHPGGFWNLGDTGSTYFKSLIISLNLTHQPEVLWKNIDENDYQSLNNNEFRLYQDSSGGKNWNHHIHIDRDNQSTVSFRGYQLKVDNKIIESGNRVSPVLLINNEKAPSLKAHIKQFWQNFPKAISITEKQVNLEIFPETTKNDYELQGGEQKTHSITLDFNPEGNQLEQLVTPLKATLPLSHYANASAMPGLQEEYKPTKMEKIILKGVEGENNFFNKREKADEYGWRNFGELWADHETLEHGNDESLVSHYNNQYDPIYGFARQYILTGDSRWFELMDDLARHVIDIDIYHTDNDRPEYNHGLFWHTDHYLDGRHCTHRTFSKYHMEIDHVEQSGGGPGSEHCYTSGLMYHYFMTGSKKSKISVEKISGWATYSNEGTNTVFERLIQFARKDIPNIKSIIKGNYVFDHKFPLSRGTGNYLNNLLDVYLLESSDKKLIKASSVIKQTISPLDDINQRQLMTDIESNWHYTIFLQSIIRYLTIKESLESYDEGYNYALSSFNHYAQWILENEKPYLKSANILVYTNDTWIAQDIRKALILSAFTKYCTVENRVSIIKTCNDYINYIESKLSKLDSNSTRILVLLMQGYTPPKNTLQINNHENIKNTQINADQYPHKLTLTKLTWNLAKEVTFKILKINIRNEINWIKYRLS